MAAEAGVAEEERGERGGDDDEPDAEGEEGEGVEVFGGLEQAGDPEVLHGGGRVDVLLVGDEFGEAARHLHRAEGDDDGDDAQPGDEGAVDEPMRTETPTAAATARRGSKVGYCATSLASAGPRLSTWAVAIIARAMEEPAERSMPPATMTMVMPMAAMATTAMSCSMSWVLASDMKPLPAGVRMAKKA